MNLNLHLLKIIDANKTKKDKLIFILSSFFYLISIIIVNKVYITYKTLFLFEKTFFITFIFINIIIAILFGIIINLLRKRIKDSKEIRQKIGLAPVGVFLGILGGACPGCVTGLLPLILSLFGISFSLLSLPFNGLELLLLSIILMIVSIYYLTKEQRVCKINYL